MARKIVITSGKGGVGKTTITTNLGIALSNLNHKVLLIDVDFGLNNLDVVMGVENRVVYDIIDILDNKCRTKQALVQDFVNPNLYILPSIHCFNNINITSDQLKYIISQIEGMFDYILIDCPAGIDVGFHRAVKCADEAIIITTPHISAIRDADKVLTLLHSYNFCSIDMIINRVRGDLIASNDMYNIDTIKELLNTDIVGVIPEDDNINLSLNTGKPIDKSCSAYKIFSTIASNINNGEREIYDCTKKYKGLIGVLRKKIRKYV